MSKTDKNMRYLLYLLLYVGFASPFTKAAANAVPKPLEHSGQHPVKMNGPDTTDALNAKSLAQAQQRSTPVPPAIVQPLPDGTIAKGTGVTAPELLDAPVYNPADRR